MGRTKEIFEEIRQSEESLKGTKLTYDELLTLCVALRLDFDNKSTSDQDCMNIISIAIKLDLPAFYISNLQKDFLIK